MTMSRHLFRLYLDRQRPFIGPFTMMIDDALTNLTVAIARGEVTQIRNTQLAVSKDEIYLTDFSHHPAYAFTEAKIRELIYEAIIGHGIVPGGCFDA